MPNEFRIRYLSVCFAVAFISLSLRSQAALESDHSIPLIRSASASQLEFEAYAHANGRKTYAEFLDRPSQSSSETLSRLVERAQEAWIDSSMVVAQNLFHEIANLAFESDWREPEREAIHYALLRLAQLTEPGAEQGRWLERANAFDWTRRADPSLFPPPLLERLQQVRESMAKRARPVRLDKIFPDARVVRINGRRVDLKDRSAVQLPDAQYRVSAYSDAWPAVSQTLPLNELLSYSNRLKPLATGSCSSPAGGETAMSQWNAVDVYYEAGCLARREPSGWLKDNSNGSPAQPSLSQVPDGSSLNWPSIPAEPSSRSSLSRRSWIWVGVSALALGAAYALYREHQKEAPASAPAPTIEPVHRQGF